MNLFISVRDPPRLPTAHRLYPRNEPDSSHVPRRHSYERERERSRSPIERRERHQPHPAAREMEYKYAQDLDEPLTEEDIRREDQQREAARIADIFQVCSILKLYICKKIGGIHGLFYILSFH